MRRRSVVIRGDKCVGKSARIYPSWRIYRGSENEGSGVGRLSAGHRPGRESEIAEDVGGPAQHQEREQCDDGERVASGDEGSSEESVSDFGVGEDFCRSFSRIGIFATSSAWCLRF